MTDEVREKYLKVVNIICEQFGLNKPSQIIYVCEAVENLIEPYMKENAELKEQNKTILEDNDELNKWVDELKAQIEKMKRCGNCSNFNNGICKFSLRIKGDVKTFIKMHEDLFCVNYDKWELSE